MNIHLQREKWVDHSLYYIIIIKRINISLKQIIKTWFFELLYSSYLNQPDCSNGFSISAVSMFLMLMNSSTIAVQVDFWDAISN